MNPFWQTLRTGLLTRSLEKIFRLPAWAPGWPVLRPGGLSRAVRQELLGLCPSGAFAEEGDEFRLDLAKCVLCGRCFRAYPQAMGELRTLEVAVTRREDLVQRVDLATASFVDPGPPPPTRAELHLPTLAFREVSAGSTGLDDTEVALAGNPFHDMSRFGFSVVASPRHADALLVTGPVSQNMREALLRTYEATPEPKGVVAVGNEAIGGEVFAESPEVVGGVDKVLLVDVYVPGSPARPASILHGLLLLSGRARQVLVGGRVAQEDDPEHAPYTGRTAPGEAGVREDG
ncbi:MULTISPECIES: NADH-quinone oxidoreductase subunit B [unclassified Meiothermus]|uniref:NADH-quinone oxidoreductase subunit B family protein n=1 Tax=unclassified Meiothermus TaxID=370471 RepID=UPI000D7C3F05|nr:MULTISPECIES: NADH-quinone oxidoreductase subunit B [unclassified Meiothermus]PZA06910.1 NADH-quinone oxidoreductase subunit B [Meiothermus sp. Pnk-1]RYM38305.1 NADH-quinone oxidoreductase subunit B [Meiothermus sp. PNK-Is4]